MVQIVGWYPAGQSSADAEGCKLYNFSTEVRCPEASLELASQDLSFIFKL